MAPPQGRRRVDGLGLSMVDHDLLIKIGTQLEGLIKTCTDLTSAMGTKADLQTMLEWRSDHEARIRVLEQFKWGFAGATALGVVLMGVVLHYWK